VNPLLLLLAATRRPPEDLVSRQAAGDQRPAGTRHMVFPADGDPLTVVNIGTAEPGA
jgi:hypothetical protein